MGQRTTITDDQLALMVDIAQNSPVRMTPEKKAELRQLLDSDFIACRSGDEEPGSGDFYLTSKGEKTLADLGVGANES